MSDRPERPELTQRFIDATAYALDHHRGQPRKGSGIPYGSHLLAVTAIVLEMGDSTEDEAIAAMLHDVVEDGGGPEAEREIRARWGEDVATWVVANSDSTSGSSKKEEWLIRKRRYIAGVGAKPIEAVRISIADKLHNARTIVADHRVVGDEIWDRFKANEPQTLWYYETLLAAFERRRDELGIGGAAVLDQLGDAVAALRAIVSSAGAG